MMVKFSAFADEVTDSFTGQLGFLTAQGLKFIEIRFVNGKNILDLDQKELTEVKNLLEDHGIGVSAIGSPIGKIRLDESFETHLDKFKHAIYLADFLGSHFIRVFSYYAPEGRLIDDYREEVIDRMKIKAQLLEGSDIVMVHENESDIFGHTAENCVDMARAVDSPHFKLAYDPANFVWGEKIINNVESCWPAMKPYVAHVHIKDWKLGSKDIGSIPGKGDGQIKELLNELSTMKYAGFLTIEPHLSMGGQFGGQTSEGLFAEAIRATMKFCDEVNLKYE